MNGQIDHDVSGTFSGRCKGVMTCCNHFLFLGRSALPVLVFFFIAALPYYAIAESLTELYGLTTDGQLLRVSKVEGTGAAIRAKLPSSYTNFKAIAYINNHFYAAYDGGKILKFGFVDGDEVYVGDSGLNIKGLAARSDGTLWASTANSVGQMNLTDGSVPNVVNACKLIDPNFSNDLEGITFRPDGTLLSIDKGPGDTHGVDLNVQNGCWDTRNWYVGGLNNNKLYYDVTYDSVNDVYYAVEVWTNQTSLWIVSTVPGNGDPLPPSGLINYDPWIGRITEDGVIVHAITVGPPPPGVKAWQPVKALLQGRVGP